MKKILLFSLLLTVTIFASERTLSIIKPDAVKQGHVDEIIDQLEKNGFTIVQSKSLTLNADQARQFYAIHKDKPFFESLVHFMTSGPVVVSLLEKDNAVEDYRKLMGSTDPKKADPGTLRKAFGTSINSNAVHGSDSKENAKIEIKFFFPIE